jgi:hypothetical protein
MLLNLDWTKGRAVVNAVLNGRIKCAAHLDQLDDRGLHEGTYVPCSDLI